MKAQGLGFGESSLEPRYGKLQPKKKRLNNYWVGCIIITAVMFFVPICITFYTTNRNTNRAGGLARKLEEKVPIYNKIARNGLCKASSRTT